ncbi:MAG TPA: phosphatase PAP2-related protein [Candidatus Paceibacterota bacterium]
MIKSHRIASHHIARLHGRYRAAFSEKYFRRTAILSGLFFSLSVVATSFANSYAARKASNSVTDIILSNTRVYDTDGAIVYGAFILIAFIIALCLAHPRRTPMILYSLGLLYFIRAFFMSITHLGLYPLHTAMDFQSSIALAMFGGGDDFFSGHAAAPFMMALLFWNKEWLRTIFIATAAFFSVVVLLGHTHYSIDVAAAFFITYAIYHIALKLFPREYEMFQREEKPSEDLGFTL